MKKGNHSIVINSDVGEGTQIWHFCNIYGSKIGSNVKIGSYVEIQNETKIGDNSIISSHSFICSLVDIGKDVFIGHSVMTVNDVNPPSFKRTGSKEYWEKTEICDNAVIGSGCVIFPVRIGKNAVVGAGSVVTSDVPDNTKVAGSPAKEIE
ncbi:MAG: N-acetyltransferase [Pelagibacteraceae bacterium TMED124]|nr:N-acetyltransferase [Candidatus Neomarinimicrobiota bacterium]RPG16586.1 MAG: N-acetyltransferase [Pelagibacteraceae bacterium TMED124]|tara:strand:- start:343 stop:795 length:453 start_codon:yes stop_codon:yes gene_type:complete